MNDYKVSLQGRRIIEHFEGLKLKPYLCSAKHPTIGLGSTYYEDGTAVKLTDKPISKERAYSLFEVTSSKYVKSVKDSIKIPISQNQFDALFCLAYNLGSVPDSLADKINSNPKDKTIWGQFLQYDKAGYDKNGDGKITKDEYTEVLGLVRRRNSEAHLYFLGTIDFYENLKL